MIRPDEIPENLVCPITADLLEDPILMPCCGKNASREPIAIWFANSGHTCPLCRAELPNFNPNTVTRNRDKASDVEDFKRRKAGPAVFAKAAPAPEAEPDNREQRWSASITPVTDATGKITPISELKLNLEGATIIPKPSLFIAIMDRSGSMSGNPWRQVQAGLTHIVSLAATNPLVRVEVVAYQSHAHVVDLGVTLASATNAINALQAGGGNNEIDAYAKVADVLARYAPVPTPNKVEVGSVTIAFLTDGMAAGISDDASRHALADKLRLILAEQWTGTVTVHSIGFSGACDLIYLEAMWKTGHDERGMPLHGTFRYTEPGDDSDMLSRKLSGVFELASRGSTVPLELRQAIGNFTDMKFPVGRQALPGYTREIQFPIGAGGKGTYSCWITVPNSPEPRPESRLEPHTPSVHLIVNATPEIEVPLADGSKAANFKLLRGNIYARWISFLTDRLAAELLAHNKVDKAVYGVRAYGLACLIIDRKAQALRAQLTAESAHSHTPSPVSEATMQRLDIISRDSLALHEGLAINAGRLGDLFGGQFLMSKAGPANPAATPAISHYTPPPPALTQIDPAAYNELTPQYVRHGAGAIGLGRNPLQIQILNLECDKMERLLEVAQTLREVISSCTYEQLDHVDNDGNNALMLAAYCGHRTITEAVLKRMAQVTPGCLEDQRLQWLEQKNNTDETALTLAVKARGYDDTVQIIVGAGATIPNGRQDALYRYCLDHRFRRTARHMVNPNSVVTHANPTMTEDYLDVAFHSGISKPESLAKMDLWSYLDTCIKKRLHKLAGQVLSTAAHLPACPLALTTKSFEGLCILEDTVPELLTIAENMFAYLRVRLITPEALAKFINHPVDPVTGDTLLFHAVNKGSPKITQYCLDLGAEVDKANALGNTPLWIACERRYPCLIDTLLTANADPDHTNLKGNSPMTTICQKGPKANAERLLATRRVNVDNINRNGDSLILICCRNGQAEILKLLLDRADPTTVNHVAHIDGFGAMHASVEANRPECVRILHEHGLSLELRTAADNGIIKGATPLHLAAYYGCAESMQMLLELGADANALDLYGQTPLHTAVVRGSTDAASGTAKCLKLLRGRSNALLRDKQGNTAASYCRDENLRKLLVDPILEPLMALSRGAFTGKDLNSSLELLSKVDKVQTGLDPVTLLQLRNNDGHTPLIESVIYGNSPMIDVYLGLDKLGICLTAQDYNGLDACTWAHIFGNVRLRTRLAQLVNPAAPITPAQLEAQPAMQNIQRASRDPIEARILFPGSKPNPEQLAQICNIEHIRSNIAARMAMAVECMAPVQDAALPKRTAEEFFTGASNAAAGPNTGAVIPASGNLHNANAFAQSLAWDAKIFTISKVASCDPRKGDTQLMPSNIAALYTYDSLSQTTIAGISKRDVKVHEYASLLEHTLQQIAPYEGETYIGVPHIPDRSQFRVGTALGVNTLMSASSSWCVAVEHVPDFSIKRQGVVLIIHGKTGRSIARYSRFTYDMEVLFPAGASFRVVAWYRGDVICLGQSNIREHTFRIKEEELPRYLSTNAALIIEVAEI